MDWSRVFQETPRPCLEYVKHFFYLHQILVQTFSLVNFHSVWRLKSTVMGNVALTSNWKISAKPLFCDCININPFIYQLDPQHPLVVERTTLSNREFRNQIVRIMRALEDPHDLPPNTAAAPGPNQAVCNLSLVLFFKFSVVEGKFYP